ncbi:MAG TPA: ATP-dependent DNA ligase [Steroidobacteraceae bacterium]|jgi:DNA ligase-1|nr:ATP-dependent DNA ligase [Steroidobacteraceae bacterium]
MGSLGVLVQAWERVAATPSRSAKIAALAEALAAMSAAELPLAVHYLAGELPQGRLGVSYALLRKAGSTPPASSASLTLSQLDQRFSELVEIRGAGSARRRAQLLAELFATAAAREQQFVLRLIVGELRAGALGGLMLEAIAAASGRPAAAVRRAAMFAPSLGALAQAARSADAEALQAFQLRTLHALEPMLAQTASDVAAAYARLGACLAIEWKLDGARIQLHKQGGEVRIYTRRLNDVAASLPEIVELAQRLPAEQLVLDGEAIALDATGRPRPFQQTMRRFGRRLDVAAMRERLPLHAYFFDCLRMDGETLVERPARERWAAQERAVPPEYQVPRLVAPDLPTAERFYAEAIAAGHEGVMVKALDAPYEAGSRGASWLKVKRAHTLDLVVLAAEWGNGRRQGWLSNLHLGARVTSESPHAVPAALPGHAAGFVMLGKTFKGLTDRLLQWQTKQLLAREISRDALAVYVRPELVVEVAFNGIQHSPHYPGGLALRFARVKRYRDDKSAGQADTLETVRMLYEAQSLAL